MSNSTYIFTHEDLYKSTTAVGDFMNSTLGCFQVDSTFARELISLFIQNQAGERLKFREFYKENTRDDYNMNNPQSFLLAKSLINRFFTGFPAETLDKALDQQGMQLFNNVFVRELAAHYKIKGALSLIQKENSGSTIRQNEKGELFLDVKIGIEGVASPEDTIKMRTLDLTVTSHFKILNGGVQLEGVRLDGADIELGKKCMMGKGNRQTFIDKLKLAIDFAATEARKHPLIAVLTTSSAVSAALCVATQIGADVGPLTALTRMTGGEIGEFLTLSALFIGGAGITHFLKLGVESWIARRGIGVKASEIIKAFQKRLALRRELKGLLSEAKPAPSTTSSLLDTCLRSPANESELYIQRTDSVDDAMSDISGSPMSDVSSPRGSISDEFESTSCSGSSSDGSESDGESSVSSRSGSCPSIGDYLDALTRRVDQSELSEIQAIADKIARESEKGGISKRPMRYPVRHKRDLATAPQTRRPVSRKQAAPMAKPHVRAAVKS